MKVKELIEKLQHYDGELDIMFIGFGRQTYLEEDEMFQLGEFLVVKT